MHQKSTLGHPIEMQKANRIKHGSSSLKEVLALFGPPDFIIDGAKKIPDAASIGAAHSANPIWPVCFWTNSIQPRFLTSPDGKVILIYNFVELSHSANLAGPFGKGGKEIKMEEIFIFVSKDSLKVEEVVLGNPEILKEKGP